MTQFEDWLAGLGVDRLETLLRLRPDVALDPPLRNYGSLAYMLHTGRSVSAALRSVDRSALQVLAALHDTSTRDELGSRLGEGERNSTDDIDRALTLLVDRGIVWPSGDGYRVPPMAGRSIALDGVPVLAPPPLRPERPSSPSSQQLAVARYCESADAVLAAVDSGSVAVLTSGGVGTRMVRSLAKSIKGDELVVELALALGDNTGLIDARAPLARCTTDFPAWRESGRAAKWARWLAAWWCAGESPTNRRSLTGKAAPVLGARVDRPSTTRLRHRIIAEAPPSGFASEDDAATYFEWAMPDLVSEAEPGDIAAVWREASILGILVDGRCTEMSAALGRLGAAEASEVESEVEPIATQIVDRAVCTLRLLPDLTAVVSGPVSERLSSLLTSAADAESKDAASIWRFSPNSVRRFHDTGGSADELLADLSELAATAVPQPLEYLIEDAARLATAGAPAIGDASDRAEPSGVTRRSVVVERAGVDPAALAASLVSGIPVDVDTDRVARTLRAWCGLPARDIAVLARAVSYGGPIAVDLTDRMRGIVTDEIHDAVFDTGVVHGWSRRTDGRVGIELSRIRMVREITS